MIDFDIDMLTKGAILYCTFMYFAYTLIFHGVLKLRNINSKHNYAAIFIMFCIIAITWFMGGDFFNYQMNVLGRRYSVFADQEPIYQNIIEIAKNNYLIFRIIVWGGASIVTLWAAKILRIDIRIFLYILFVVFIDIFSYARATLAMSVYFLGASIFITKVKISKRLLGLVIIGLSYIFHHSIIIAIGALVAIYAPINKHNIKVYLLASPVIFILMSIFIKLFVFGGFISIPDLENRVDTYSTMTATERNLNGLIQDAIMYMLFFYPFIIITRTLYFGKANVVIKNEIIHKFYRIILLLVLLSLSFLTVGLGSTVFTYRILYMTFLPITFVTTWLYTNKYIRKKNINIMLLIGILYSLTLFVSHFNHAG